MHIVSIENKTFSAETYESIAFHTKNHSLQCLTKKDNSFYLQY